MPTEARGIFDRLVALCLRERLAVIVTVVLLIIWGVMVAPFAWDTGLPRDPVPVDAIPNLGDNQQIIFVDWPGRSPRDVEDQITYPLSSALLGVAGVRDVRSLSMFGFSSIAVIFEEDVEFYWSRSRLLEKLSSLPAGTLPPDVQPALGPDATALGQVLWFTLEGRDPDGKPTGGWDLHELRSLQDWTVKPALLAAQGISEVASVGGVVQEYLVEVNPDALRVYGVTLEQVAAAVQASNLDVGAGTTEINRVEYALRGVGLIKTPRDIEQAVVHLGPDQVPLRVRDLAKVSLAPEPRRGVLDVSGAEAVGGVVTVRQGFNPRRAIENVRERLDQLAPALPRRAVVDWSLVKPGAVPEFARQHGLPVFSMEPQAQAQWLHWLQTHWPDRPSWLTSSQVTLVPFYDRAQLIDETLGTLKDALTQQLLVTIVVVLVLLNTLRGALAVVATLPMAVLLTFIGMKLLGVEANIVALAGIAIAIGTIVDMGIIITENVFTRRQRFPQETPFEVVYQGVAEVSGAVVTAIATTVISFLPVFVMSGAEGKLFTPLAFTKTLVLLASVVLALTLVPVLLRFLLTPRSRRWQGRAWGLLAAVLLVVAVWQTWFWLALAAVLPALLALGYSPWSARLQLDRQARLWLQRVRQHPTAAAVIARIPPRLQPDVTRLPQIVIVLVAGLVLAGVWEPLGPVGSLRNSLFVLLVFGLVLGGVVLLLHFYDHILRWCLVHKTLFLSLPLLLVVMGLNIWLGFERVMQPFTATVERAGLTTESLRQSRFWSSALAAFPGLGREFMPALDEGAFLWMPSTMPHASIGEVLEVLSQQNRAIAAIAEVESAVGKAGRADTPLDPAPLSMFETIIQYKSEYRLNAQGRRELFRYDRERGEFVRDAQGELIRDAKGRAYRQWRAHIHSPDDIWQEIVAAARMPGSTSAPKLQPIETRLVMLQTGMRAAMGIKVLAPDLERLEPAVLALEDAVRQAPGVAEGSVNADRPVGQPWLEFHLDRERIARHGLSVAQVQMAISTAVGGEVATRTVEGRERYAVRVRYPRELRQTPEQMKRIQVATPGGASVPLEQLVDIRYLRGPQMIRTENTFLAGYVTFGAGADLAEVDVVEAVQTYLSERQAAGDLRLDAGVSYSFAGSYQNQIHAAKTLLLVIPLSLSLIFMLLYFQFRAVSTALIVFSGVAVAWAGGFIMVYLYGQEWFANFSLLGANLRELFNMQTVNLSIAVWVGFLALFGIAVDDGVVMGTYLKQRFAEGLPKDVGQVRDWTLDAARRRVKPCLMTSATTILALLPVLSASGRGADLMIPMAIPTFGGLAFVSLSMFVVPVLFCWVEERRLAQAKAGSV